MKTIAGLGALAAAVVALESCIGGVTGPRVEPLAEGVSVIDEIRELPDRREIDLRWGHGSATLSGTLFLPPGEGPYPVVVAHFGSDRWTRSAWASGFTRTWVFHGYGLLSYDKRGVGASTGSCCPWRDPGYFELLAGDVVGGLRAIRDLPGVDRDRIGLWGFSQGGWIVPVAAVEAEGQAAFAIIGSGPAVTLGEELLYSELSGDDECRRSGLSDEEIERRLDAAGPSGFDPRPWLERLDVPVFWIFGGADTSIPVGRSVRNLEDLVAEVDAPFTIRVIPGANHAWILGGEPCQTTGQSYDWASTVFFWLAGQGAENEPAHRRDGESGEQSEP